MKKALVPLALTLAFGVAACGKSGDATNTSDTVVLNDEDAVGDGNVVAVDPVANGEPGAELDNIAVTDSNASLGNTL